MQNYFYVMGIYRRLGVKIIPRSDWIQTRYNLKFGILTNTSDLNNIIIKVLKLT